MRSKWTLENDWPKVIHQGKIYGRDHWGDYFVWRCTSRRTGRHSWRLVRDPAHLIRVAIEEQVGRAFQGDVLEPIEIG